MSELKTYFLGKNNGMEFPVYLKSEALHQCIMYGGYMDDMMAGKCLLLFVLCDGEPMATAEIDRKGKIVQFYADQQSDDMTPTPEADAAVKQWLKTYKPKFKEAA